MRVVVVAGHETFLVHAVAAGAACDLLGERRGNLFLFDTVVLDGRRHHDALDRHVQAHGEGVRADDDIGLPFPETLGLRAPDFRRQVAVDGSDGQAHFRDHVAPHQHVAPRERDDGVAPLQVAQLAHGGRFHRQRRLAFQHVHFERTLEALGQRLDRAPRFRCADEVHDRRRRPAHGRGPGGAAVAVGQHLDLVDDGDLHRRLGVQHLDGTGDVRRAFGQPAFLARDQAHLDRLAVVAHGVLQALVVFQRQQAQRREVDAAVGLGQVLHRAVRLAGIGGSEQRDETARHPAGDLERRGILGQVDAFLGAGGVTFFLLALDGVQQALADAVEHELGRLGRLQLFQHVQEQHRVEAEFVGLVGNLAHEFLDFLVEVVDGIARGPFLDEVAAGNQVHLAPLAGLGEHAARRHEAVLDVQAIHAHGAGKAQEHAAFHPDQLHAAAGQAEFAFEEGVVVLGVVIGGREAGIVHNLSLV